jgi:hypothetical protein
MVSRLRYFRYHESVVFSISRVRPLHGQHSQRASWACPHGEERGEKHGDYREERRAQCGEGHKESGAHCGPQGDSIVEPTNWDSQSFPFTRLSLSRGANKLSTVSNTKCWKLSNRVSSFHFRGNDRAIAFGPYNSFAAGS